MRKLLLVAIIACLAGAGWYALRVDRAAAPACGGVSRLSAAEVEKAFSEEKALIAAGHDAEASLLLEKRVKSGDAHKGIALFLLGEVAFEAGAESKAIERYADAIKADPTVADRGAPFEAERKMLARAQSLRKGKWSGMAKGAPEVARLSWLERRLTGGCQ